MICLCFSQGLSAKFPLVDRTNRGNNLRGGNTNRTVSQQVLTDTSAYVRGANSQQCDNSPMHIVFITHRNPWPPLKGTQVRPYHMIKRLAERGHRVHLFGFLDDGDAAQAEHHLGKICESVHLLPLHDLAGKARAAWSMLGSQAPSEAYFRDPAMHRAIARVMQQAPIAAFGAFSSTMAQYVPPALRQHAVLDMCDVDSAKWQEYIPRARLPMSIVYRTEARRLAASERQCVRDFAATVLATDREAQLLAQLAQQAGDPIDTSRLMAITNGTDLDHFHPQARMPLNLADLPESERQHFHEGRRKLVFTGAMDYAPNIEAVQWFCSQCWPTIRAQLPQAEFLIVGSKPAPAVQALAQEPGVRVTGFVDDVRPYLNAAELVVVPLLLARGVQNKALEAMACGKAIVATPAVAAGLQIDTLMQRAKPGSTTGEVFKTADSAASFTQACLDLLADGQQRQALGERARAFVEQHYAWAPLMDQYAIRLEQAAKRI